MLNNINKTDLFYDYYAQWITVYKEGAIRKVTMDKYLLTQSWIKQLAPNLKVCELSRITYQKLLNDYAKLHERQTTMDFHHQIKAAILDAVDEGFIDSVFERENLSETALGNLIAIPHAFEGHIKRQGIGVMTLKKPINWGDEKVQLIFLLSLDVNSKDYIKGIFGDVLELTKDKKAMEVILKARKFSEMFR